MKITGLCAIDAGAALRQQRAQRGFSLVELMIALSLGLVILAALTTLYADISRTNQEMAKTNSQIENARFAMQFLQNDIVHAGYWGGFVPTFDDLTFTDVPTDVPALVPNPCLAHASWTAQYPDAVLGIAVQSYDTVPTGCGAVVTDRQAGTDVLVVRHAETCVPGDTNCEPNNASKLYFQPSFCNLEIDAGTRYKFDADYSSIATQVQRRQCTVAPPTANTWLSPKRKYVSNIYYVRDWSVTAGDGIPTLVRSEFDLDSGAIVARPAEALIEGIEGFRVEFGIDSLSKTNAAINYNVATAWANPNNKRTATNRGNGIPEGAFVHCTGASSCTVAQLLNVVAVKVYILARANSPTPGYTDTKTYTLGEDTPFVFTPTATATTDDDHYKRHAFSTTVRLTNVSGRRETP